MGAQAAWYRRVRRIVADTGPLLHLQEAQALTLLPLAGTIAIPPAVDAEMRRLDPGWQADRPPWIQVVQLTALYEREATAWYAAGVLDQGEAEAIALARQDRADWILTDDAAARLVAEARGVEVHGSLGVVLWAAAAGHLGHGEAETVLDRLVQSSLWLSPRVVAEARAALKQLFT